MTMKKLFLFVFALLCFLKISAQPTSFSDSAIVSLITCSPGEEVYEKFGHTAIRVKDVRTKQDVVYNYGIFDFNTPNFYYNFIKGQTDYQLGVYNTDNFLISYSMRNSVVWEQILNLTTAERKKLIYLLLENYKPENRTYRYNFIFDNCATRPRDKIISSLHGYVKYQESTEPKTYRQWVGTYVGNESWLKFGIDLIFGMEADHFASASESMFLPEVLMSYFQTAQINTPDKQSKKLIYDKKILVQRNENTEINPSPLIKPLTVSLMLLIIGSIATLLDFFRHKHNKQVDTFIFISTGLLGFILAFMMLFSIQPLVKLNLNILWLNPFNLIVGVLMWFKKLRIVMFYYQITNMVFLTFALFAFALSIQNFNVAVFPIIVLMLLRSASWVAYLKQKIYKHKTI